MEQKPFAAFDIDGTLIRWQLYHAIFDTLAKQGSINPSEYTEIRNARMAWKQRSHEESFKDYERRMVQNYDAALQQLSYAAYEQAIDEVFEEYKDQAYAYTKGLIKDLKQQGYLLFAISGSQNEIVGKLAKYYGFDDWVGADYPRDAQGAFTGEKIMPAGKKHEVLARLVKKHEATTEGSIAVGDSAGDISMLEFVERPIAFNPEKQLYQHARAGGWEIVLERKNVIYNLKADDGRYILD